MHITVTVGVLRATTHYMRGHAHTHQGDRQREGGMGAGGREGGGREGGREGREGGRGGDGGREGGREGGEGRDGVVWEGGLRSI